MHENQCAPESVCTRISVHQNHSVPVFFTDDGDQMPETDDERKAREAANDRIAGNHSSGMSPEDKV